MERSYRTHIFASRLCRLLCLWFAAVPPAAFADDPVPTFHLNSVERYQAVHVPFKLTSGQIIIPMELSGKQVECQFDSGMFTSAWNKDLRLSGRRTGHTEAVMDVAGTISSVMSEVVLPQAQVGNYEVRNFPTYEMDTSVTPKSFLERLVRNAPLVSNDAFCRNVLTIDYYKKELIIRNATYDFTKEVQASTAQILTFTPTTHDAKRFYGRPIVDGKINGYPARILMDTGWISKVCLDENFVQKITAKNESSQKSITDGSPVMFSDIRVQFTTDGESTFPVVQSAVPLAKEANLIRPAIMYPKVQQAWDATVGYDILRFFRITIDYPRQRILLEPYGEDVVKFFDKPGEFIVKSPNSAPITIKANKGTTVYRYADKTIDISQQ